MLSLPKKEQLDVEPFVNSQGRKSWLHNNQLDCIGMWMIKKKKNAAYLPVVDGEKPRKIVERIEALLVDAVKTVIYPYRNDDHFQLLIVQKHKAIHYDSNPRHQNLPPQTWKIKALLNRPVFTMEHYPIQTDSDNCGVFVMLRAGHFLDGERSWTQEDADKEVPVFRKKTLTELEEHYELINNGKLYDPTKRNVEAVDYSEKALQKAGEKGEKSRKRSGTSSPENKEPLSKKQKSRKSGSPSNSPLVFKVEQTSKPFTVQDPSSEMPRGNADFNSSEAGCSNMKTQEHLQTFAIKREKLEEIDEEYTPVLTVFENLQHMKQHLAEKEREFLAEKKKNEKTVKNLNDESTELKKELERKNKQLNDAEKEMEDQKKKVKNLGKELKAKDSELNEAEKKFKAELRTAAKLAKKLEGKLTVKEKEMEDERANFRAKDAELERERNIHARAERYIGELTIKLLQEQVLTQNTQTVVQTNVELVQRKHARAQRRLINAQSSSNSFESDWRQAMENIGNLRIHADEDLEEMRGEGLEDSEAHDLEAEEVENGLEDLPDLECHEDFFTEMQKVVDQRYSAFKALERKYLNLQLISATQKREFEELLKLALESKRESATRALQREVTILESMKSVLLGLGHQNN